MSWRRGFEILVCVPHKSGSGKGGAFIVFLTPSPRRSPNPCLPVSFSRHSIPLPFPSFPLISNFVVLLLKTLVPRFANLFLFLDFLVFSLWLLDVEIHLSCCIMRSICDGEVLLGCRKMSRGSRIIYVGNLPGDIREREVEDLFYKVVVVLYL